MATVDWGSVPTWVATIGALVAVAFTARSYVLNRQREAREQASRVACWIFPSHAERRWVLALLNGSELPVYSVAGTLTSPENGQPILSFEHPVLAPNQQPAFSPLKGPNDTARSFYTVLSAEFNDRAQPVPIRFRDSAGVSWRRDKDGRLHLAQPRGRLKRRRQTSSPTSPSLAP